ncbi:MAG: hypothetical protein IJU84_05915 [Clostridia bacterium]|nr:hypothetical protein [Clostridia bacterium]
MNGIFFFLVTVSLAAMIFSSPDDALSSMLAGGEKALQLTVTMTAVYALWLGLIKIAEESGVIEKIARVMKKPIKLLFGNVSKKAEGFISMNLAANLLGMGGVATPMGIAAAKELDETGDVYAMNMLFAIAATSVQLLPTSVISLRAEAGSSSPGDIILPTLIATAISTALAAVGVKIIAGRKKR